MADPAIVFDGVWKKFRKGERHDSLRDLIPNFARNLIRPRVATELGDSEFWVLKDVSFEVLPGEALGIIGQNGAGKSTALKLLTRILRPTRGHAHLHGRVGALIEIAAGFHPDLTGRENVYLQGAIMGMRRDEIQRHFDAIVAFSGLEEFIDTPVKRYSSGMNARLGFSIAAHLEPDVLLIDEVLAVGDFTFQQKCYERLREFRRSGTAIAFVSHNMQAVAALCDRALLLRPNQVPVLDEVSVVTAAYIGGDTLPTDSRLHVESVALRLQGHAGPLPTTIRPGDRLVLDIEMVALDALPRCAVALQVVRSDGTVMFTGMSTLDGMKALEVQPGDRVHSHIGFTANVLRGTYTVNVNLVDEERRWPAAILNGLSSFVVAESNRIAGCAELAPEYRLTVSPASCVTNEPCVR